MALTLSQSPEQLMLMPGAYNDTSHNVLDTNGDWFANSGAATGGSRTGFRAVQSTSDDNWHCWTLRGSVSGRDTMHNNAQGCHVGSDRFLYPSCQHSFALENSQTIATPGNKGISAGFGNILAPGYLDKWSSRFPSSSNTSTINDPMSLFSVYGQLQIVFQKPADKKVALCLRPFLLFTAQDLDDIPQTGKNALSDTHLDQIYIAADPLTYFPLNTFTVEDIEDIHVINQSFRHNVLLYSISNIKSTVDDYNGVLGWDFYIWNDDSSSQNVDIRFLNFSLGITAADAVFNTQEPLKA